LKRGYFDFFLQHPGGGGHALAAPEVEEDRVQVAEEGGEAGDGRVLRLGAVGRAELLDEENRQPALSASPSRVSSAASLLPLRRTLVAPGLPEP
jgi:hypothetical protein